MSRNQILETLLESAVVAIIRMPDAEKLKKIAEAIYAGGVSGIEITMTTPNALNVITELSRSMGDVIQVGVGSVTDRDTARRAVDAGARYIVSPVFKQELIDTAHEHDVPCIPGCFSPTEILTAYEGGADIIKVFPADVLGMAFIKGVKAPMPQLPLMPTGGVTPENAGDWIRAGACAVGVGSALLDKRAIAENDFAKLTDNAKILKASVEAGKSKKEG
ncbi:bifunctional 4-hydroxy-2-oxoglutarate aldolase/2-dehydro-3-deoxy-phosphogluconate aldolase [bacterium]|nr:bifunctional 4-hydroxy-2-oxoglutarate aldolase/2-dehydro-3-deoxy-phosphogluconate aldolase [bacterium]